MKDFEHHSNWHGVQCPYKTKTVQDYCYSLITCLWLNDAKDRNQYPRLRVFKIVRMSWEEKNTLCRLHGLGTNKNRSYSRGFSLFSICFSEKSWLLFIVSLIYLKSERSPLVKPGLELEWWNNRICPRIRADNKFVKTECLGTRQRRPLFASTFQMGLGLISLSSRIDMKFITVNGIAVACVYSISKTSARIYKWVS